jgi:phosphoglycolate phosphatase
MKYDCIFWDWNGTLLDDARVAWLAVNDMLTSRKLPLITFEQYREYIDVPIVRFYERVMDMSKENMHSLSVEFDSLWAKHLPADAVSKTTRQLLFDLNKKGIKQYIFSSSRNDIIKPYLQKFEIRNCFTEVIGATDRNVGSKAERTRDYIASNGIDLEKTVFIGDMVHDFDVASFVGAKAILVSSGHQSKTALVQTGAAVISSLSQLYEIINLNTEVEK